jgi:hypothetical protein
MARYGGKFSIVFYMLIKSVLIDAICRIRVDFFP